MAEPVYPSDEWQQAYMRQLASQIVHWKRLYYYGTPEVDDATFDLWWHNLLFLEKKYPHLADPNSPTATVGAPLAEEPKLRKLTLAELMSPQPQPRRLSLADMRASVA